MNQLQKIEEDFQELVYDTNFDEVNNKNIDLTVSVSNKHLLLNEPAFKRPDKYNHNIILVAVLKSYTDLRWEKPSINDINVMVNEIKFAINNRYKGIRIEEIPDVFADGIRKVYGDFMGLSIVTFEMFIMGYLESIKRKNLALTIPKKDLVKEPTLQERFTVASKNAMDAYLAFQAKADISLVAPAVYRFLRGIKLFQYTDEEQEEFMSEAKQQTITHLNNKKATTVDKFKRMDIGRVLENLNLEENKTLNEKVVIQAQRLGLYSYFQTLMMEESDLQELINQHKPKDIQ